MVYINGEFGHGQTMLLCGCVFALYGAALCLIGCPFLPFMIADDDIA